MPQSARTCLCRRGAIYGRSEQSGKGRAAKFRSAHAHYGCHCRRSGADSSQKYFPWMVMDKTCRSFQLAQIRRAAVPLGEPDRSCSCRGHRVPPSTGVRYRRVHQRELSSAAAGWRALSPSGNVATTRVRRRISRMIRRVDRLVRIRRHCSLGMPDYRGIVQMRRICSLQERRRCSLRRGDYTRLLLGALTAPVLRHRQGWQRSDRQRGT